MSLKPRNDKVIVKPKEEETTSAGGIVLAPSANKDKPQSGVVVSVGEGKLKEDGGRIAIDLKAGDEVLYAKYSGTEFKLEGEDYLVLSESDILAVVE